MDTVRADAAKGVRRRRCKPRAVASARRWLSAGTDLFVEVEEQPAKAQLFSPHFTCPKKFLQNKEKVLI